MNHDPGATDPLDDRTVTRWLGRWHDGERDAAEEVFRRLYGELKAIARSQLRVHGRASALSATELVHEAYLRLELQPGLELENRSHFLGITARLVRNVLVDEARRRGSLKRGAGHARVHLTESELVAPDYRPDVLSLEQTLGVLEQIDERQARLVELRFFGGLTMEEVAEVLGVSEATASRIWRKARAWLVSALEPET